GRRASLRFEAYGFVAVGVERSVGARAHYDVTAMRRGRFMICVERSVGAGEFALVASIEGDPLLPQLRERRVSGWGGFDPRLARCDRERHISGAVERGA